ncbi:MAG TPA: hypothetical protein VGF31_08155 [Myxococcaceae bacterium]
MRALRMLSSCLALALMLAAAPALAQGVGHFVSVGGPDQDATNHTDANFSLVAHELPNGRVTGQWSDQFGQGQGGIHVQIDCLFVAGNEAWVSGTITHGTFNGADLSGLPVITRVQDNGGTGDQISFSFIGNAASCTTAPNLPLQPMTSGQVIVR